MNASLCSWCKSERRANIKTMNETTLHKLASNPHYKMTADQKNQMVNLKPKKPMNEFGVPNLHDNEVEKHDTKVIKKKVYGKKQV